MWVVAKVRRSKPRTAVTDALGPMLLSAAAQISANHLVRRSAETQVSRLSRAKPMTKWRQYQFNIRINASASLTQ